MIQGERPAGAMDIQSDAVFANLKITRGKRKLHERLVSLCEGAGSEKRAFSTL